MASLLHRLGLAAARRPLAALLAWLIALALAVGGFLAFGGTLTSAVTIPNTPTAQVTDRLQAEFPEAANGTGQVVFVTEDGQPFTDEQKARIGDLLDEVGTQDTVDSVVDPFATQQQQEDAAARLEDGTAQIADGEQQIADGRAQLEDAKAQAEAGREKLDASKQQLDDGQAQLDAAREQAIAQAQAAGLSASAAAARVDQQLAAQQAQLDAGLAQYEQGKAQLDAGDEQIAQNEQKLDDAEAELEDGKTEAENGRRTLDLAGGYRTVSEDGSAAVGVVSFVKPSMDLTSEEKAAVTDVLTGADIEGVDVHPAQALNATVPSLVGPAEVIGLLVAAAVLVIMLGTFIAGGLPLINALIGVGVGVAASLAFSGAVEMMSVTPMLGIMLGLAVGIDYALFIVNRHRQELRRGTPLHASIALANGTSGNAVVFAGLTVIIALLALNVTGIPFLGMMGTVGAACVAVAVLVAVTLTPALLSLVGMRVLRRHERRTVERRTAREASGRADIADARAAVRGARRAPRMSTPVAIATALASIAALVVIALPFGSMRLGLPDGGSEPVGSDSQIAYELVDEKFGEGYNSPLVVTVDIPDELSEAESGDLQLDVGEQLAGLEHVDTVVPAGFNDDRTIALFQIIPEEGPNAVSTESLVHALRDLDPAGEASNLGVAGMTSGFIDVSEKLSDALPLYMGVVVGLSLLIMVLVFRSLLVPLIATGGFVLSVFAAMGGVVAIYQWGWLGGIFGVHNPGPVLSFLPTIMIGVLFGLAMDYQLFIASGMREAYAHGQPARDAVMSGLRAGRAVVIAAAIIMIAVFGGFVFAHDAMIRPIGFGLALGVLLDAFVVRLLLMPALMHLLDDKAWWLPRWLDRILPDVDVEGASLERHGSHAAAPAEAADAGTAPAAGA